MSTSPSGIGRRIAVAGLPPPTGPYAWAVSYGGFLFISGLRGICGSSGRMAETYVDRIALIFDHLDRILSTHGCRRRDVFSTRVYVTEMTEARPLVNDAYRDFFGDYLPTRTIVEVQRLNDGDTVEIEVVAACPADPEQGRETSR